MEQDSKGGTGQRLGVPVQHHDVLGVGLAGEGQGHDVIPGHDIGPGLDLVQSIRGIPFVGRKRGVCVRKQVKAAVAGGDLQPSVHFLHGLYLMVMRAASFLGDIAHNGEGGGLRREGTGADGAVEHMEMLAGRQALRAAGGHVAAVNPEGLAGDPHHIFAGLLGFHKQAHDGSVLPGDNLLDRPAVQQAVRKGLDFLRPRFCGRCGDLAGRPGRESHGAEQYAAQRQGC